MYNDNAYSGIKNVSPDLVRKMNEMIRLLKYNSKQLHDNLTKIISSLTSQKLEIKTNQNFSFTDD